MSERNDLRGDYEDESVRQAYRALADEEVPATLDAKVMQAASAALSQRSKPAWMKWSAPLALAASLVVVVAVLLDPTARKSTSSYESRSVAPAQAPQVAEALPPSPPAAALQEPKREEMLEAQPKAKGFVAPAPRAEKPEDVTVTARQREDTLQDVPLSIVAMPAVESPAPEMEARAEGDLAGAQVQRAEQDKQLRELSAARASTQSEASRPGAGGAEPAASPSRTDLSEIIVTARRVDESLDSRLHRVLELETEGRKRRAEFELQLLEREYPNADVRAALKRLRKAQKEGR